MTEGIVEIRDYTIDSSEFDSYREWACKFAAPWLLAILDVIDFWLDGRQRGGGDGYRPACLTERSGQRMLDHPLGRTGPPATKECASWGRNSEWQAIWARHPCPDAYLQRNSRFMKAARDVA